MVIESMFRIFRIISMISKTELLIFTNNISISLSQSPQDYCKEPKIPELL